MPYPAIVLLLLLFSSAVFSQSRTENFQFRGKFDFENPNEAILAYDLFEQGKKLRLVGPNNIQFWDVENNKVLDIRRHDFENLSFATFGGVSPDKTRLLVLGFETKAAEKDAPRIKTPAKIYDLDTAKLVTVLDKTARPVRSAVWSKNGKTLVTADNELLKPGSYKHEDETQICFWEGRTLEFRACASVKDATWFYLSEDGESFFTTSVPEKKGWFGIPFVNGMTNVINVWNARTAKNERNLAVGDANFHTQTYKLMPSPDGKYFALVSKNKDTDAEHRVLVWQIGNGELPKYAIKANPKIRESMLSYSPDGKYFALDAGKTVQIYELENGRMVGEFAGSMIPTFWLDDNRSVIYNLGTKIRGVRIPKGDVVFEEPVIYRTEDYVTGTMTDSNGNTTTTTETVVVDSTTVVPHPDTKSFLTYSNQSVKVYDAVGRLVQALVTPPPVIERKEKIFWVIKIKIKDYGETTVSRAEWSDDGKSVLVINPKKTTVSVWQTKN